jgi:CHAD domain-containing protein
VQPVREDPGGESEAVKEFERVEAWKKVRKLALKQLNRFMSLVPKVLGGDDPDAIHDLRVASRRLQQVLDLLYPQPRPSEIRKLRRKIRRCRRVLGEVRNCDVQLARVERTLAAKRRARREIWEAVCQYLRQRRSDHFEKALKKLSKMNLAIFYVHLKGHLAPAKRLGAAPATEHLSLPEELGPEQFYERISQSLESAWHGFETQIAHSQSDPKAGVIHGVRIAAKRVRYLIEVVHAFDVPGSKETVRWLRGLQTHLGNWHDMEVLEQVMIEMLARPEFLRDHLPIAIGVEKLILRHRKGKEGFKAKYFAMTRDSKDYERVQEWVAGIVAAPREAFEIAD